MGDLFDRLDNYALSTAGLFQQEPAVALVDGLLYRDTIAMLYGRSGAGKSFFATDLAFHLENDNLSTWHGLQVGTSAFVYVVAEGAGGMAKRVDAWQKAHDLKVEEGKGCAWVPFPVNLHDRREAEDFAAWADAEAPGLIIFDTLARCTAGADENSTKDMGIVVDNAHHIREATGACVLLVHHTGHAVTNRARGNSALVGAVDTELELSEANGALTLRNTKQKDGRRAQPMTFRLEAVANSCVIRRGAADAADSLPAATLATLEVLRRVQGDTGAADGAWKEAAGLPPRTYYNHRRSLIDAGLVENIGSGRQPLYHLTEVAP